MRNTAIAWCHHTCNPWAGCTKKSPGCEHCYAEREAVHRYGYVDKWGPQGTRRITTTPWEDAPSWDRSCAKRGVRERVFVMSWGDLFEDRPEVVEARARFWALTQQCTNLDWLILTKSPENIARLIPQEWHERGWPANIWLGVTAENQQYADLRIPLLAQFPAVVRFVSCEPLLGPIDLSAHLHAVDWVIVGGESGDDARPMRVEWARALRDQCVAAEKTLFFKQWGMHLQDGTGESLIQIRSKLSDHHLLDGVLHQAWPTPRSAPRESRNT